MGHLVVSFVMIPGEVVPREDGDVGSSLSPLVAPADQIESFNNVATAFSTRIGGSPSEILGLVK